MFDSFKRKLLMCKWYELILIFFVCLAITGSSFLYLHKSIYIGKRIIFVLVGSIGLLALFNMWTYAVLVKPAFQHLSSINMFYTLLFCLLSGGYLLTFLPKSISRIKIFTTNLAITAIAESNPEAINNQVVLTGFTANETDVSYSSITQDGNWQRKGNELHAPEERPASLYWQGWLESSRIAFQAMPEGGKVLLRWNDEPLYYDTYSQDVSSFIIIQQQEPTFIEKTIIYFLFLVASGWGILLILAAHVLVWKPNGTEINVPDKQTVTHPGTIIFSLVFALIGIFIFWILSERFEMLINTDSDSYLHCGRQLLAGNGYISANDDTFVWWTPLYPGLLAILESLPFGDTFIKIRICHTLLYGGTLFLTSLLYHDLLRPKNVLQKSGLLLIIASGWLQWVFAFLLSEALFIFTAPLFFYGIFRYIDTRHLRYALLFAFAAVCHTLTRYNGVAIVVTGCAIILLLFQESLIKRAQKAVTFGIATFLPMLLWLTHNYTTDNSLTGIRTKSKVGVQENIKRAANVISGWYMQTGWRAITILIILIGGVVLWVVIRRRKTANNLWQYTKLSAMMLFIIIFLLQMIITFSIVHNASISNRLLSVVFVPLTIILLWLWHSSWKYVADNISVPGASILYLGVLAIFIIQPLSTYSSNFNRNYDLIRDSSFTSRALKNSEIISYIQQAEIDQDIAWYSNCSRCVLVFAEKQTAIFEPYSSAKYGYLPNGEKPFYIIWFDNAIAAGIERTIDPFTEIEPILQKPISIQVEEQFNDGYILYISPTDP